MDSSQSTELRQRVENLERCLLEAQVQMESKVAPLVRKQGLVNLDRFLGLAGSEGTHQHSSAKAKSPI